MLHMKEKSKKILLWLLDLAINVAIIFILVLVIQKWIIAPFDVSGASMCDTLNNINGQCTNGYGEKIIINEAIYLFNDPERGDIVVFKIEDSEEKYFIKRIIGLPGDKVEIKGGDVYLTPKGTKEKIKLKEDYLNAENRGNTKSYFSGFSVFNVPDDKYFVLGDNRQQSTDSRSCFQSNTANIAINCKDHPEEAFIERKTIRGKAWVVWWPLKNIRALTKTEYPEIQANSESLAEK